MRCPPITSYLDRLIDFVREHFEQRQAAAREADDDPAGAARAMPLAHGEDVPMKTRPTSASGTRSS